MRRAARLYHGGAHIRRYWRLIWEMVPGRLAALVVLVLLAPATMAAIVLGSRIRRVPCIGQNGRVISSLRLLGRSGMPVPLLSHVPALLQIVSGRMAWVGPRARGTADLRSPRMRQILSVAPGLVSSFWLRERTNMGFEGQEEIDAEYVSNRSSKTSAGILVRSALVLLYGGGKRRPGTAKVEVLGLPIDNLTMDEAIAEILSDQSAGGRARQVSFLNADCVNVACRDGEYRRILQTSGLRLADGIGLKIAAQMLGTTLRQNVNGTDLFPRLCRAMATTGESVYLLGARPGVACDVACWAKQQFPGLRIAGERHGFFAETQEDQIIEEINASGATVLLVAMGAPRQEKWIRRHLPKLRVRAALGVGGLFDFYSGRIPRAPLWLRELGLEWTYRLYQEPGRMWRRYLVGNFVFLMRVTRSRMFKDSILEVNSI